MNYYPVLVAFAALSAAFGFGFFYAGVDRKLFARMQNRRGPPILQPLYDALKLLFAKETLVPESASSVLFVLAPYITFASLVTAVLLLPLGGVSAFPITGDVIVLIYVIVLSAVGIVLGASASGSPFAAVGASREITLLIAVKLPLALAVLTAAVAVNSFSLTAIYDAPFMLLPFGAAAFFLVALAELGKTPFDIAEAEQEIAEGVYTEYSGRLLGLFKVSEVLKFYVLSNLFVVLFVPLPAAWGLVEKAVLQLVLAFLFVIVITLARAVTARYRIEQAARFYLYFVALLALAQMILVYL